LIFFSLNKEKDIKVTFLDVGQGDAILIEEGSNQILIDGGENGKIILEKLGENMPFWDRKIEVMIITHPDSDHYGGLVSVLDNYEVLNVLKTDLSKSSKVWKVFEEKIKKENSETLRSIYGLNLNFSNGASLKTVYPFSKISKNEDSNDSSVVMRLDFGENSFLFTGDLPGSLEDDLVKAGIDLNVDFLKIAHHGSKNSTTEVFLEATSPQDAIVSVGTKNSYKHPHREVLDKLKNRIIRTWRTDEDGDIFYVCKNNKKCEAYSE
jgi:competence protein ComEC